jgi:hypothetical protein
MGKGEMKGKMEKDGDVRYSDGRFDSGCVEARGLPALKRLVGSLPASNQLPEHAAGSWI